MRTTLGLICALAALSAAGRVEALGTPRIEFVTDLADVAGCQFLGPVRAPAATPGERIPDDYRNYYYGAYEQRALARGVTHIYVLNRAARWGGASAFGVAYACR